MLRLLFGKQVLNTKGYSGSNNVRSGVKNVLINNFTPCDLSNISNVECLAVIPKSVRMVTMLLFIFFVLLSAAMIPDKSAVVALRGGGGSGPPSFDGVPGFGGLPGPGGLPTFGGLPVPSGGAAPSHIDSGSGFHSHPSSISPTKIHPTNNLNSGDHKNINPNNVHPNNNNINPNNNLGPKSNGQNNLRPNNAPAAGHCTGYGASINPCGPNAAPRRDNLNPAEQHCTGYGISVNPCGNHPVDPCLVNPCPISPCVINPCPPSYGRIIVGGGGDSSTTSYSSSPVIVKDESSDTSSNNNQAQGSSPNTIPIANTGSNRKVHSFDHITLDGSKSYDPDGKKITYSWRQLAGGPIVLLSDDQNVKPTFEAPQATDIDITLTFQLIVNNGNADSSPAYVTITVQP